MWTSTVYKLSQSAQTHFRGSHLSGSELTETRLKGMTTNLAQQLRVKIDTLGCKMDTMAPQVAATNAQVNTVHRAVVICGFSVSTLRVAHRPRIAEQKVLLMYIDEVDSPV
jgi:hypothetical protein